MEKIANKKFKKFFSETDDLKATVPIVFYWIVVWLSFFNVIISPYTEIILCVVAAYSLFLSIKSGGLRKHLPAFILLIIYTGFGLFSYIYNKNAGIPGLIMPFIFISLAVLLLNERFRVKILCALSYLSCFIWVGFSLISMFSSKDGLCETTLNLGLGYVLLFFCVYAVSAYRGNEKVSPYLPVFCLFCSMFLLCREGSVIFGVITVLFIIFDFNKGKTLARNHPQLIKRLKTVFNEQIKNPQRAAVVLFFAATAFILFILYFIKITTTGLIQIPKNGVLGGTVLRNAISNTFVSPYNLFLGSKSMYLPSMLKNSDVITSSFFNLHSNYGMGMFVSVMAYSLVSVYRFVKTRNYLFFTLFGMTVLRMLFDSAAFPGFLDVAMLFFLLYPSYEKNPDFYRPPVLKSVKTKNTLYHNKVFFCICSILVAMLILKLYAPKSIVIDVVSLTCMALLVFSPLYTITPLLITNFFNQAFYFQGIPYAAILTFIFILGLILHYIRTNKKIPGKYILISGILICWFLFSAVLGYTHNIDYACVMGVNIIFILLMAFYSSSKQSVQWAIKTLFFSCSVILITVFVLYIFGGGFFREGHFTLNMQTNPNSFAKGVVQMAAIFFGGMLIFRTLSYKLICAFMVVLSIFLIFLSGSRSAFLGVSLGIISMLFLYSFFKKRKDRKLEWSIILSLVAVGLFMYILLWLCDFEMIRRFTLQSVFFSGGTGRTDIWKVILTKILPDNLFFGVGFGEENVIDAVAKYSTIRPNSSHNFLFGVLVQLGIVGSVVFFVPYVRIVWRILREKYCNKMMPIFISMLMFAIFNGIGEAIVDLQPMWIAMAFALFLIGMNKNKKTENLSEQRYWGIF
ncbi:MAG: hypothetical protein DBX47_03170 [Clostridiales bacterium]|nr:MAG: hypothetical protein DBX47_03170 [Clostridiales bacterium]